MSKKPVDFVSAMQTFESREGVQRHPKSPLVTTPTSAASAAQPASMTGRVIQRSRIGKVSIGLWVDPAVRKQIARLALDLDKDQADLIAEGLNLMFERYGKPTIAQG